MTHEFTPDWKLSQQDQLQVHLSIALTKHVPGWPGATDEQLAAVAADLTTVDSPNADATSEQKAKDIMDEALLPKWYCDNGVYSACVSAIAKAIDDAVREEREMILTILNNLASGYAKNAAMHEDGTLESVHHLNRHSAMLEAYATIRSRSQS
jgi:hypothetical protein